MRAADAVRDDPAAVPDEDQLAAWEADVVRLRALGCCCPLRYKVDGEHSRAVPLNEQAAATCTVDHSRS